MRSVLLVVVFFFGFYSNELFAFQKAKVDSLEQLVKEVDSDSVKSEIFLSLFMEVIENDLKKSLKYANRAIETADLSEDYKLKNKIAVTLGSIYLQKGLFEQSISFYQAQLELGKKINNLSVIGRAYFNLGTVRLILEDYAEAKIYFDKALSYINSFNESNGKNLSLYEELTINNALGLVYTGLGEYEKAETLFKKSIKDSRESLEVRFNYAQLSNNYADLLIKINRLEEAKLILKEIIRMESKDQDHLWLIVSFLYLGKAEMKSGNFSLAKNYFLDGMAFASKISGFSDKKHLAEGLSEAYEKLNKADSALYFLNLSLAYEDSLSIQKARDELLKKELEDEFVDETSFLKMRNRSIAEHFFLLLMILFCLVLIFYFYFIKTNKKIIDSQKAHIELEDLHKKIMEINSHLVSKVNMKDQEIILAQIQTLKESNLNEGLNEKLDNNFSPLRSQPDFKNIIFDLKNSNSGKSWEEFDLIFRQIHGQFFEKLLQAYPDLTLNERRLSAFLKLQFTTKEIANLTGQSNRAIELARTRLRKKLGLTNSDQSLIDFFLNFNAEND